MKTRFFALFLAICMLFSCAVACADSDAVTSTSDDAAVESDEVTYDFKVFNWGDSVERVMEVEGEQVVVTEGDATTEYTSTLRYESTVVGLDTYLIYYFCDEGLYQVIYWINESHSNESLYIDDYNKLKSALTDKYGEPTYDLEHWDNDTHKKYYADNKGDALCYGYLKYGSSWDTETTDIFLGMSADNYEVFTGLYYSSLTITPNEPDYSGDI